KPLDQMFERAPAKPGGIEEILQNPNLSDEQKQQILQQLLQQQKHGSLDVHEQDVPVAWYADADGSARAAPTGATTPAATGAAPAASNSGAATGGAPATGGAAPATAPGATGGAAPAPGAT